MGDSRKPGGSLQCGPVAHHQKRSLEVGGLDRTTLASLSAPAVSDHGLVDSNRDSTVAGLWALFSAHLPRTSGVDARAWTLGRDLVNKRKIRAKDAVNTVRWLSKTDQPKADIGRVRVPYSKSMQRLLLDPARYYTPKERPSQHNISEAFGRDNAGALPSNLLVIPNSQLNDGYLRTCKALGLPGHPARFPLKLPAFFIELLTDPGDLVVDFFGGSNTSGRAAEV
jgi:hypothetical protein